MDHNITLLGFVVLLVAGLIAKIVWKYFESGKIDSSKYLTIESFEKHKSGCCILDLKRDFNDHKNLYFSQMAGMKARMEDVEERLKDGREDFQKIREDNAKIMNLLGKVQTSLEFLLKERELNESRRYDHS